MDIPRNTSWRALVPVVDARPVEVIGEGEHEIPHQYIGFAIEDVVVTHGAGDALVLVEDIVHGNLDFPIFLLKNLPGQAGVP